MKSDPELDERCRRALARVVGAEHDDRLRRRAKWLDRVTIALWALVGLLAAFAAHAL